MVYLSSRQAPLDILFTSWLVSSSALMAIVAYVIIGGKEEHYDDDDDDLSNTDETQNKTVFYSYWQNYITISVIFILMDLRCLT